MSSRLVAALSNSTQTGAQLAALVTEAGQGLVDANTIADRLQQISLDPAASSDLHKAIEGAQLAALVVKRLETVLPRLRLKHQPVAAKERAARFNMLADRVQANRDALVVEFAEIYPQLISQLVDLFQRIGAMDQEVDHVNGLAPNSESRRLVPTDTARLVAATKLSDLAGQPVWPRPTAPILPEQVMPLPSHPGRDWAQAIEQRTRERQAESQRVAAYYANQTKTLEDKQNAEARAARERGRP